MIVGLDEAKNYLKVDSTDDDEFITGLITAAEGMISDICRKKIEDMTSDTPILRIAELYAVAYLYEHREEADHKALTETLKYMLFSVRGEAF